MPWCSGKVTVPLGCSTALVMNKRPGHAPQLPPAVAALAGMAIALAGMAMAISVMNPSAILTNLILRNVVIFIGCPFLWRGHQRSPLLRSPLFVCTAAQVLGFIRLCVALPWEMKTGSLPSLAGCGQAVAGVFALFCRRRAGWKVHCGAGVPSAVTVSAWTACGRVLGWCWSPLPGNPRCCCVRVCQSPVLIVGLWRAARLSLSAGGLPLQEVAARMKVLYERVAGIDVHKDMIKVAIRSPGDKPWARKTEIVEFRTFYGVLQQMAAELRRRGGAPGGRGGRGGHSGAVDSPVGGAGLTE